MLAPGTRGKTWFTTESYDSKSLAFDRLSLYEQKDYRIAFQFVDNPKISGGDQALATYFEGTNIIRTNGGGIEYWINEIARIRFTEDPVPLGP